MERASEQFTDTFCRLLSVQPVQVWAGMGNNGGDGLCIARLLADKGWPVSIIAVRYSEEPSPDFLHNEWRAKENRDIIWTDLFAGEVLPPLPEQGIVIEAVWGSGLNRGITGWAAAVIEHMNRAPFIVSVDMPSGLPADTPAAGAVVEADVTITFQRPKLSQILPDNSLYVGDLMVVDIGLDEAFMEQQDTPYALLTEEEISALVPDRPAFGHKGTFGHALVIAGRRGSAGAAILSARACLRTGAGLATVLLPAGCETALHAACPEAMAALDTHTDYWTTVPALDKYSAIGIGPALGTDAATREALLNLLSSVEMPLVLDADALNILSDLPHSWDKIPPYSILTPHPGEFTRMTQPATNGYERLAIAQDFARAHQLIVILKGAYTAIVLPEGQVWFNPTGNPGMATAGSGDVLTGILTGLLAQGLTPPEAAMVGVYLHGLAGDLAAEELGEHSLLAGDIVAYLPKAFTLLLA